MTRVLIADPQPFFCRTLGDALTDAAFHVTGWSTEEREAIRLAEERRADIVLTEVQLTPGSGLNVARALEDRTVVVLTRRHEGDVLLEAVAAGARGCVSHDVGLERLLALVREAAAGQFVLDADRLHGALIRAVRPRTGTRRSAAVAALTGRERDILDLLVEGLDNEGIARRLHLSSNTVRTHVGNVLRKLGVHSRAEAASVYLRQRAADAERSVLHLRGPDLGRR